MKPKVCNGVPEINGQCLDEIINDIGISLYNMEYETFERGFLNHGGDRDMAQHLWNKWKKEHNDNFLWAYGNLTSENQRKTIAAVLDNVKERNFRKKWDWSKKE